MHNGETSIVLQFGRDMAFKLHHGRKIQVHWPTQTYRHNCSTWKLHDAQQGSPLAREPFTEVNGSIDSRRVSNFVS